MPRADVVVIGAGLAGLTCAAELAESGARVILAAKGMATTHWTHGGLDVAAPAGSSTPRVGVRVLAAVPGHPYAAVHAEVDGAVEAHRARLARAGHLLVGSLDSPHTPIPTALGSLRPASILPGAQTAAVAPWAGDGLLLIGFAGFRDAWPAYAARNLRAVEWPGGPRHIRHFVVELPGLQRLNNLNARSLAVLFDDAAWRATALGAIGRAVPHGSWRIGIPAVLGIADHPQAHADVEESTGHRVFEIPSLPPSVPGVRLFDALRRAVLDAGGRVQVGFDVVDVERDGHRIVAVHTEAAARTLRLEADAFVLATGGIGGTGIRANADGSLHERVFGLAVEAPPRAAWFSDDPLTPHPLESVGIRVDAELRPLDAAGHLAYENVHVIGSALAGMRYLDERCGDGVALASAHRAARSLATRRQAA